jgi:hypothetical protein
MMASTKPPTGKSDTMTIVSTFEGDFSVTISCESGTPITYQGIKTIEVEEMCEELDETGIVRLAGLIVTAKSGNYYQGDRSEMTTQQAKRSFKVSIELLSKNGSSTSTVTFYAHSIEFSPSAPLDISTFSTPGFTITMKTQGVTGGTGRPAVPDNKLTICIDFDGVIHDYKKGWQDGQIYGNVTPGFFEWAEEAGKYFKLVIYSTRSRSPEEILGMQAWLATEKTLWGAFGHSSIVNESITTQFEFAHQKPKAFLTIDDRAIRFEGNWQDPELSIDALRNFKSWVDILRSQQEGQK